MYSRDNRKQSADHFPPSGYKRSSKNFEDDDDSAPNDGKFFP